MELSYPPFETINTQGKPCGISVEIAYALGRYLQRDVSIENIPFIGLIPSLKSGKIDLILSSMTKTEEREKSISFSDPYVTIGLCLLISKKSDLQGISQADSPERKITVKRGTSAETWANEHLKNARVITLDQESSCILEVVEGKADAFIYDQFSIYRAWQKYPQTTRANLTAFQTESWAIGLRQQDTALRDQVNAFLQEFRAQKGFSLLADKYLKKEQEAFQSLGVPFPLR
jgi:polar amino acid transport system substrate-binding protein